MTEEIKKLDLKSKDLTTEKIEQLKQLFPEVVTEGDGTVDFEKLREILGAEVNKDQEGYGFTWPGKAAAMRLAEKSSEATLRPCVEKSRGRDGEDGSFDSDNIYIEGDNLEVLMLLQRSYHGRIKMIYIDPPYNTGHDFVYKDTFADSIKNYKEQTGLTNHSNPDTSGRFHSNWCSMMYPRLRFARELLSDDGVIFISIDDCEYCRLCELVYDAFGPTNVIATIVRNTNSSKNQSQFISVSHEYCIAVAKDLTKLKESLGDEKWGVDKNNIREYLAKVKQLKDLGLSNDEITNELKTLTKYPRFIDFTNYWYLDEKGLYRKDNLGGVSNGNQTPLFNPLTGKDDPVPPGGYRYSPEKLEQLSKEGRIHFHTDGSLPTVKRYLSENMKQRPKSIMSDDQRPDYNMLSSFGIPFDNPKQLAFMQRILSVASDDAIVLDFFSGSATTAHAVMQLNAQDGGKRTFIMVQLPEACNEKSEAAKKGFQNVCEIGEKRIRCAGDKIKAEFEEANRQLKIEEEPRQLPDIGFRVFKLDESGIEKPDLQSDFDSLFNDDVYKDCNMVKPGREDLDIIYEMMLDWGLDLSLPIEKEDFSGYYARSVGAGDLICCMEDGLNVDVLRAIADSSPRRVLMFDSVLNDTIKLNALMLFDRAGIELRTV